MAPVKGTRSALTKQIAIPNMPATGILKAAVVTRKPSTRRTNIQDQILHEPNMIQTRGKRKAETSPAKNEQKFKRTAFGNLTNNGKKSAAQIEDMTKKCQAPLKKKESQNIQTQALKDITTTQNKIMTRAAAARIEQPKTKVANNALVTNAPIVRRDVAQVAPIKLPNKPTRRISNEFNKTEESLYMSALEDISSSSETTRLSGNFEASKRQSIANHIRIEIIEEETEKPPEGVENFDLQNWNDPFQVSHYAMDIFNYLKSREEEFFIDDYMPRQVNLSRWMRTLLVDWMVEVQETFELNHETLYLGVKLVDLFLCRVIIHKDKLQLLGAAALFIACKFDERTPPLVDDFLYICDGAYKHNELIKMEMTVLRTIDYDLGVPLSYRFLRRYARCAKVSLPTLTLARYILELSLMDYDTIGLSDSRLASAALFMALRMHGTTQPWSATFEYYTSYKLLDFASIVPILNAGLHRKPKQTVKTIFSKYSHKIFHEVAAVPLLSNKEIFKHNLSEEECSKLKMNMTLPPLDN